MKCKQWRTQAHGIGSQKDTKLPGLPTPWIPNLLASSPGIPYFLGFRPPGYQTFGLPTPWIPNLLASDSLDTKPFGFRLPEYHTSWASDPMRLRAPLLTFHFSFALHSRYARTTLSLELHFNDITDSTPRLQNLEAIGRKAFGNRLMSYTIRRSQDLPEK